MTFDQREILRHLNYVCLFVRPSIRIASERKKLQTSSFTNRLVLAIGRSVSAHRIVNQTGILAHEKSDSHQILYLGSYFFIFYL